MKSAAGEQDPIEPSSLEAHHLAEVVDFRPDQGIIRLHEQRVVRQEREVLRQAAEDTRQAAEEARHATIAAVAATAR